jgi:hypothetical protein
MPYMTDGKRDYKKQNDKYDSKESVKKDRAARNKAREMLKKEGVVSKGDGKDVDHKTPLSKGGSNARGNLRAVKASANKSFARKSNGAMK